MTKAEHYAIKAKYETWKWEQIRFAEVADDMNALLDALPESPRNTLFRTKYGYSKAEHDVPFWIAKQDVVMLLAEVVPIESEKSFPSTEPTTITLAGATSERVVNVVAENVGTEPEFPEPSKDVPPVDPIA